MWHLVLESRPQEPGSNQVHGNQQSLTIVLAWQDPKLEVVDMGFMFLCLKCCSDKKVAMMPFQKACCGCVMSLACLHLAPVSIFLEAQGCHQSRKRRRRRTSRSPCAPPSPSTVDTRNSPLSGYLCRHPLPPSPSLDTFLLPYTWCTSRLCSSLS